MTKYPFSKKALKAMLAATIALSPVVTTGVVFQPSKVEASLNVDQEIDTLAERFFVFYQYAGTYGFTGAPETIDSLDFGNISATAEANHISLNVPSEKQTQFAQLMQNTATLIYTKYNSASDLASAIKLFKANNTTIFNSLFEENGDLAADQFIYFVMDLEGKLEMAIADVALSGNPTYANVIKTAVNNTMATGENKDQYQNLDGKLSNIGLSVESFFLLQDKLNNGIVDTTKSIRSAMMQSAFQAKGADISRDDNTLYLNVPVSFLNGTRIQLGSSVTWESSNSSVATISGNTLTPVSTGQVTVYAKLDGIKLASKSISVTVDGSTPPPVVTPPVITPPPVVTPPVQGDNVISLPEGAAEVVKVKNPSGKVEVVTKVNKEKVADIVNLLDEKKNIVSVVLEKLTEDEAAKAQVPSTLFTEALKKNAKAIVAVQTDGASYQLPASQLDFAKLSKDLGGNVDDLQVNVSVNVVDSADLESKLIKTKSKLASKVIDFTVNVSSGESNVDITRFSTYVNRNFYLNENINFNKSVGVIVNADGTLSPVPTEFVTVEGKKIAVLKSLRNSKYTIVENDVTFADVDNKNWAQDYIETLASKFIIKGKEDGKFAPSEQMTRAQFTVLLVRALGLPSESYTGIFSDVKENDWYNANGELAAALKSGIIQGKPDGSFAPNEKITRTQAAIMISRAMNLDFINFDQTQLDTTKKVTDFSDSSKIADYAKSAIEAVYQAGIMSGKEDATFDPKGSTKRDQMSKILAEFLISAKLMNDIKE
ncbi:S-layer homology domain-containing protein [Neobacillus sp. D3-1R]|uniref:S-layer homology domain-containing protein n=1 Tax=Neobacillus sp. D3-1R TaxID=3445778 RepID=UPI003FA059F4